MNSQLITSTAIFSIVIAFFLTVNGQVPVPQLDPANTLPAGAELIIGQLKPGFTCDQKGYGYYADPANNCRVFHVCSPIGVIDEHGVSLNQQWTFICGNQTLFNQERLVCDRPENVDCSKAESFYSVNKDFRKIPRIQ